MAAKELTMLDEDNVVYDEDVVVVIKPTYTLDRNILKIPAKDAIHLIINMLAQLDLSND